MTVLPDILFRQAEKRPDQVAVRDPFGSATYAALRDDICGVATGLAAFGVAPGNRVLIVLPNGLDFVRAHFGAMAARAISVPCESNVALERFAKIARRETTADRLCNRPDGDRD